VTIELEISKNLDMQCLHISKLPLGNPLTYLLY